MYKELIYLLTIRFRKLFSRADYTAMGLVILGYLLLVVVIFNNYNQLKFYSGLFLVDSLIYHLNRRDMDFLKLKKSYKRLIFVEYLIYTLPIYLLLLIKKEWWVVLLIFLVVYGFISLPKRSFKAMKYPFSAIDPQWLIGFRKYKLMLVWPLSLLVGYLAIRSNNDNLIIGLLFALALITCLPTFEKERADEVGRSVLEAKSYLELQWKANLINALYVVVPLAVLLALYSKWSLLIFLVLPVIAPLVNVVLRYVFYHNLLLQQLFFAFFIGVSLTTYGISLLVLPFLYKKAIANIHKIKYAEN